VGLADLDRLVAGQMVYPYILYIETIRFKCQLGFEAYV
jgi:hypothetical protein